MMMLLSSPHKLLGRFREERRISDSSLGVLEHGME